MADRTSTTCPDPELVTALVDDELDVRAATSVRSHLASCAACRALVDSQRAAAAAVRSLGDPVPSPDLAARLLAIGDDTGDELADRRRGRAPALLGAAASVAVFMVGAFAFIGASASTPAVATPRGSTAIVPAADRLTQEHAATSAQAGVGAPGFGVVNASYTTSSTDVLPSAPVVVAP